MIKYIRDYYWSIPQLTTKLHIFCHNSETTCYKEFELVEGEISDLQLEKYSISFETKKYTTLPVEPGDENVIYIRAFKATEWVFHTGRVCHVWCNF